MQPSDAPPEPDSSPGRLTALVIDGDPASLGSTLAALAPLGGGIVAHTASGIDTARAAAEKMAELDLLITPAAAADGAEGFVLRDELKRRFPGLRTAFLSGYDLSAWGGRLAGDVAFAKPADGDALRAWVRGEYPPAGAAQAPAAAAAVDDDDDLPVAETVAAPGNKLGDYELLRLVGGDAITETHEAIQRTIDRRVALVLLKPEAAAKREAVREFRGLVRARARVSHPRIAPVYEGYEEGGAIFYTRELIEGKHLPELFDQGQTIDEPTLVDMVRAIGDGLSYLDSHDISHDALRTRHIYLGSDGQTRLANLASLAPKESMTPVEQIRYLGAKLGPFLAPGGLGVGKHLLAQMRAADGPATWEALAETVAQAKKDLAERTTYNVKTQRLDPGARRKQALLIGGGAAAAAIAAAAIYIAATRSPEPPAARQLDTMVRIAGGEFPFGADGETATLPTFWIDRTEVTIAEYAAFLEAIETSPAATAEHDHEDQPSEKKSHQPDDWDSYYLAAKSGARYGGRPVNLNCPVAYVDWWDAYAYASWRGRRLPTEQEWEMAARGKDGLLFPWGDRADAKMLRPADAFASYTGWRPVDKVPGDISPGGVHCMAGNVGEWTGTRIQHPEIINELVPVTRGGSFRDPAPLPLTHRRAQEAEFRSEALGFRTASDTDPTRAAPAPAS